MKLGQLRQLASQRLQHSTAALLEIDYLLMHILSKPRSYLFAWPDKVLSPNVCDQFETLFQRRLAGEPIAYILESQAFYGRDFIVTPDVLIPRAETELLIDKVLQYGAAAKPLKVLDIGTGSGAIAVTLQCERENWQLFASDISPEALLIAQKNCLRHHVAVNLICGDVCAPFTSDIFDIIVSNPPYIAANDVALEANVKRYEPYRALIAEQDGLEVIVRIIQQAYTRLSAEGYLFLEHGYQQQTLVIDLLEAAGFLIVEAVKDLAGHPRVVCAKKCE